MFLDDQYLLGSDTARRIHAAIADLPVVDPHNHADVKAIAANRPFTDLWQLFAATDHYVWEVMRKRGVPEELITGGASAHDKFLALARIFPELAGNPVYEWVHLDLRSLGIAAILDATGAEAVWEAGNRALAAIDPIALLARLNVEVICSTDDPADRLEEHAEVNRRVGKTLVRPTWRPDKAMKLAAPGWRAYLDGLGARFGKPVDSLDTLLAVLQESHDYFDLHGCRASDHGLELMVGDRCDRAVAEQAFRHGNAATPDEQAHFAGVLMNAFGEWNARSGWVTQLHLGAVRDVRASLFARLGPDSGGDIGSLMQDQLPGLLAWLNRFDDRLKVVLYCLDPMQQPTLAAVARAFGANVRLGSAWWLCDTPIGMKRQLEYIGSVDLLMNFAGMVSDSRKLPSYGSRFAVFRRVLADVLGGMVDAGQMPLEVAIPLAQNMSYHEPKRFFNL